MPDCYFDWAAAAPFSPEFSPPGREYALFANCDSLHHLGVLSETAFNGARGAFARNIGAAPEEIIFTSGATESNNLAIKGAPRRGRVITSNVEHPSVSECVSFLAAQGNPVTYVKADQNGAVTADALEKAVLPDTVLASFFYVNAETGVINDIEALARVVRQKAPRAVFHADAAQALGKLPLTLKNVDLMSFSSHKIFGPNGLGALFVRKGLRLNPLFHGGGQQNGVRPGTINLPAVVAFAQAADSAKDNSDARRHYVSALKNAVLEQISQIEGFCQNGADTVAHILNISFDGVKGEVLLNALSNDGIYISTGSACHAKRGGKNTIAQFAPERADFSVRISFSHKNTDEQCALLAAALKKHTAILRGHEL